MPELTSPWGLDGLSIVVMGAGGGGIGTSISRFLGHAGASVVAVDIDAEKLKVCTDALEADGTTYIGLIADGRDKAAVAEVVDKACELAPLRGSVQVAGGMWPPQWSPFASDDPAFDDVIALNFGSTVNTVRAVARRWGARSITVNTIEVELAAFMLGDSDAGDTEVTMVPVLGQPALPPASAVDDVIGLIDMLASPAAGAITGALLVADRGTVMQP